MPLYNKPLEAIGEADLQGLIDNEDSELRNIEYKSEGIGHLNSDKKEFLADVSSFANAIGGDLVLGMHAEAGVPKEIRGIAGLNQANVDGEISRLDNIIRNGIRPPIRFTTCPLPTSNGIVLIVRVHKGYAMPHQIVFDKDYRFYARGSNGKYRLDVDELRTLFDLSGTLAERIRNFRAARLADIVSGQTPVALDETAKIVLHLIPLSAFDPSIRIDVRPYYMDAKRHRPLAYEVGSPRYNFDGLLRSTPSVKGTSSSGYVQLYTNGIIEAVDAYLLSGKNDDMVPFVPGLAVEQKLLEVIPGYLQIQEEAGIEPPMLVMLSLIGVRGYFVGSHYGRADILTLIDRNDLIVPEVQLEAYDVDLDQLVREIFEPVWRASGWPSSPGFGEDGKRKSKT